VNVKGVRSFKDLFKELLSPKRKNWFWPVLNAIYILMLQWRSHWLP